MRHMLSTRRTAEGFTCVQPARTTRAAGYRGSATDQNGTLHRGGVPLRLPHVQLLRATDLGLRGGVHFSPKGDPPRQPPDREQHGEHTGRKSHRLVDNSRIKVDVRVESALFEVVIFERNLLKFFG